MATYVRLRGLSRRPFRVSNSSSSSDVKIEYSSIQTVDIDDQQTLRHLRNSGEGRYITASDNYFEVGKPSMGATAVANSTNSGMVIRAPRDLVIKGIDVFAGSNTGTAQYDVKYCTAAAGPGDAGTSIFGTVTANRPLLGSGTVGSSSGSVVNTSWPKDSYLRVELAAISGTVTNFQAIIKADQI